jgi:beta-glucosidase
VIQLYIKDQESCNAPTNPVLCGFQRIALAAGECRVISVPIDPYGLTVVTEEGQRIPGSGSWMLYAGFGQPDARTEALTGKKAVYTELH